MSRVKHEHEPHKFFFETLSSAVRWEIIRLLREGSLRATDIAKKLHHEQSLVSHHLKRLLSCGFVSVEQRGSERVYHLNSETIKPLLSFADLHIEKFCKTVCCAPSRSR